MSKPDPISQHLRKMSATVRVGGESKYPVFDEHSARSALRLIHSAKPPLTPAQEAAVRAKAAKYLGGAGK